MIFILVKFSLVLAQSEISEKDCQTYDYSDRYPPIRDQNGHGLCWAFTSAALIEEQLCLESRKPGHTGSYQCGEKLSVLDVSRCQFNLGIKGEEGWYGDKALKCILGSHDEADKSEQKNIQAGMGICPEHFAPYANFRDGLKGYIDKVSRNITDVQSFTSYLLELNHFCPSNKEAQPLQGNFQESISVLQKLLPEQEKMGVNFKQILNEKNNDQEYLRKILITPECEKNRIQPTEKISVKVTLMDKVENNKLSKISIQEKVKLYQESLLKGRSLIGTICYNHYSSKDSESSLENTKCIEHAVLFGGLKWNPAKKQCEVFLRNSWGQGAILNGRINASSILKNTTRFTQLGAE